MRNALIKVPSFICAIINHWKFHHIWHLANVCHAIQNDTFPCCLVSLSLKKQKKKIVVVIVKIRAKYFMTLEVAFIQFSPSFFLSRAKSETPCNNKNFPPLNSNTCAFCLLAKRLIKSNETSINFVQSTFSHAATVVRVREQAKELFKWFQPQVEFV